MWYVGERTTYIDEKGNLFELRYGDEVDVKPCEENNTEFDYFSYEVKNLRTGKTIHMLDRIEDMLDIYTTYEGDVDETDILKKPIKELDKNGTETFHCPNCYDRVYVDDDTCDNCMQALDWEE